VNERKQMRDTENPFQHLVGGCVCGVYLF